MEMNEIKAKDMLHQDYEKINEDETISKALSLLEGKKVLLVFEKDYENYKGVLTEKKINRSFLDPETKIKKLVMHAPKLNPEDDIIKISKLMFENDILQLPVFENNNILGIVDDTEILKKLQYQNYSEKIVNEFMSKNLITINIDDKVGRALALMRKKGITRLPVLEAGKLAGLITLHDIIENVYKPKERFEAGNYFDEKVSVLDAPVKDVMVKNLVTVKENSKLKEVMSLMLEYNLNSIIVVDENDSLKLKGLITRKDLLEPLTKLYEETKPIHIHLILRNELKEEAPKEEIIEEIERFIEKWNDILGEGTITADIQKHKEKFRKLPLIFTRLRITTDKIKVIVNANGWGYEQSIKNALKTAEEEFFKYKEIRNLIPKKKYVEFLDLVPLDLEE